MKMELNTIKQHKENYILQKGSIKIIPKDLEEQLMNIKEVATVLNKSCNN